MIPPAEDVIQFACTSCGAQLSVPATMAGITGPCPHCRSVITSPASSIAPALQPIPSLPPRANEPAAAPPAPGPVPLWQQPPAQTTPPPNQSAPAIPGFPQPASPAAASLPKTALPPANPGPLGNFTRTTPALSKEPLPERSRSRSSGRPDRGRRVGALLGGLFFLALSLAGAGWFFKDQVKVYWARAVAKFQKADPAEDAGSDPAVAALLEKTKQPAPGAPRSSGNPASVPASDPASKPATFDPGAKPVLPPPQPPPVVQTTGPTTPTPPAPAVPSALPVEMTRKAEMPPPALADSPKQPENPNPANPVEPPAKKALPVESENPPAQPAKSALPDNIPPVFPTPPRPGSTGLVEVPGTPKPGVVDEPPGQEPKIYIKANAEARPAADTLSKFFQAKSWQERLLLTQPQEKVRPLMERYYSENPDGPVRVKSIELIRHEKTPEIGTPLCVFQVSGPDLPEPLPVMVESSPEGWKVDWLTFTEFKDKLLFHYLQKWQDEPARFHVMVRRTHYFDEDVPNLDKKHCFELMPPTPGYSGFAFIPKGTPLAQKLDRAIGWEVANVAAIVELRWRKQDRYQWVEITEVPQFNWRSTLPAIPVAQPAKLGPDESGTDASLPPKAPRAQAVADKK